MRKKARVSELLSSIKKIRSGEASAAQLYEISKDALAPTERNWCLHTNELNDDFVDQDIVDDHFDEHHEESFLEERNPWGRPSFLAQHGSPFIENPPKRTIESLFTNHNVYKKKNTLTELDLEALESLDHALSCDKTDTGESHDLAQRLPESSYMSSIIGLTQDDATSTPRDSAEADEESLVDDSYNNKCLHNMIQHNLPEIEIKATKTPVPSNTHQDDEYMKEYHEDLSAKVTKPVAPPCEVVQVDTFDPVELNNTRWTFSSSHLVASLEKHLSHDSVLFYLMDIHEESRQLFLYGKTLNLEAWKTSSCCIILKDIDRNIFVHPRESILPADCDKEDVISKVAEQVNEELGSIRKKLGCPKKEIRLVYKGETDKYFISIALNSPDGILRQYVYSSQYPPLPLHLAGDTFDWIFGCGTSLTELLLLKRKIHGPSWLVVHKAQSVNPEEQESYCKKEFLVRGINHLIPFSRVIDYETLPCPPLNVLSLSIQSGMVQNPSQAATVQIIALGGTCGVIQALDTAEDCTLSNSLIFEGFALPHHLKIWPPDWKLFSKQHNILLFDNDQQLLSAFLNFIHRCDVDIFVGHNLLSSAFPLVAQRIRHWCCSDWDKLSRHRRPLSQFKQTLSSLSTSFRDTFLSRYLTIGRLLCDTEVQAREMLRGRPNFDLASLIKVFESKTRAPALRLPSQVNEAFQSKKEAFQLVSICKQLSQLTLRLMCYLQILTLTKELTCIAGNLWNRSLLNYRAERNEMLLLHHFHKEKLIMPEPFHTFSSKGDSMAQQASRDSTQLISFKNNEVTSADIIHASFNMLLTQGTYTGGLVLEPRTGFYDRLILLLDFKSLYPSIIQEYNICFTTTYSNKENQENSDSFKESKPGLLPVILKHLVERRRNLKMAMKSAHHHRLKLLDIRQQALKLTANSIYGCLGFRHSRFYAKHLAALITQKGRELLQETRRQVECLLHLNVLYGDTDSLMVDTGIQDDGFVASYTQAVQTASHIQTLINKSGSCLELELECVMTRLLLLKKKKYAGLKVIDYEKKIFQRELKGLDIVRRDWCGLTKRLGHAILNIMFDSQNTLDSVVENIHDLLRKTNTQLISNSLPLDEFIITKGLNKMPQHYPDSQSLPHVHVAKRLLEQGSPLHIGSEIEYIICKESASLDTHFSSKAHTLQEVQSQNLTVNIDWYKTTQILPVIIRLCEHLEGTDANRLAQCLDIKVQPSVSFHEAKEPTISGPRVDKTNLWGQIERLVYRFPNTALLNQQSLICVFCRQFEAISTLLTDFLCHHCEREFPITVVLHWFSRFIHSLFFRLGRFERLCTESQTSIVTTRALMYEAKSCPQASCCQFKGEPTLVPTLKSCDAYHLAHFILYAIGEHWKTRPRAQELIQRCCQNFNIMSRHNLFLQPLLPLLNSGADSWKG